MRLKGSDVHDTSYEIKIQRAGFRDGEEALLFYVIALACERLTLQMWALTNLMNTRAAIEMHA